MQEVRLFIEGAKQSFGQLNMHHMKISKALGDFDCMVLAIAMGKKPKQENVDSIEAAAAVFVKSVADVAGIALTSQWDSHMPKEPEVK